LARSVPRWWFTLPLGLGVWSPAFTVRSLTFRDGWGGFPVVPSVLLNGLGTFLNGSGTFPNQPGTFPLGSATFPDRLGTFLNGSGSLQFTCRFLINTFQNNNLQTKTRSKHQTPIKKHQKTYGQ
jgi:hypothetical protein